MNLWNEQVLSLGDVSWQVYGLCANKRRAWNYQQSESECDNVDGFNIRDDDEVTCGHYQKTSVVEA